MAVYHKAIRDKIPEIIKNSGNSSIVKKMSDEKFLAECNRCGGEIVIRHDDHPEAIATRIGEFYTFVIPTIEFFKRNGKLITVDGERTPEEIYKDIVESLGFG